MILPTCAIYDIMNCFHDIINSYREYWIK